MAGAQLALTHQAAITLGGEVLSENWALLRRLKRKHSNTKVSEKLNFFANTHFASFSVHSFFPLCTCLFFLALPETRKRGGKHYRTRITGRYTHISCTYPYQSAG